MWETWYIFATKLIIKTSNQGILYQLKPFQKNENFIPFYEMLEVDLEATDFLTKFGGWGKRQKANEVVYVFNDGIFLKIKTLSYTLSCCLEIR